MKSFYVFTLLIFSTSYASAPRSFVESIGDPKEWKKLLRTRTNILVMYSKGKPSSEIGNLFAAVSREMRGTATLVEIDCSGNGKKLCKKNKVDPSSYILKHYKNGEYHKDYDRRETQQSMITFLNDPSGDLPWDEDPIGKDVIHISDMQSLSRLLKSEKNLMMMFYAPWCGFCKKLKPDYSAAATELAPNHVLAAMDVNRPQNSQARTQYNITGFPTLVYFENGTVKYVYDGENNKAGIVAYMKNPSQKPEKPKEEVWADSPSSVVHLTDDTFHAFIKSEPSVLVMFYAPWCGHCKRMKPEYTEAAETMAQLEIAGKLAAVDSTKEKKVTKEFEVKGFPSIKYFKNGQYEYEVSSAREKDKIIEFMKDPKEPPPPPLPEKPWSETESAVYHLNEENFKSFLKKKKHVLALFYAPWCGHCKKVKPEFTVAAEHYSNDPKVEFAALDCTVEQTICGLYDVHGYPTFRYFNYYKNSKPYTGGRTASDFIKFMKSPEDALQSEEKSEIETPEQQWKGLQGSQHLAHLSVSNFEHFIKDKEVLVMFYAPWCGHCKSTKLDYSQAALELDANGHSGVLATVDATSETSLATKYNIKGFPTFKFFRRGIEVEEYNGDRKAKSFVAYMRQQSRIKNEL